MRSKLHRICIISTAFAVLCACAAGNTGAKLGVRVDHVSLPSFAAPAPINLPPPCPADMLADLEPEPQPAGGFPAPETASASAEVQAYWTWLSTYAHWARRGWARAAEARAYCMAKP